MPKPDSLETIRFSLKKLCIYIIFTLVYIMQLLAFKQFMLTTGLFQLALFYPYSSKQVHILVSFVFRCSETPSWFWFCCSGRIPRLSLNQHSLYVRVVKKSPPPPLTGEQYGKMEPKYPEGGHCQSVLRPQGVFNVPLYFK